MNKECKLQEPNEWSVDRVSDWIQQIGWQKYSKNFKSHDINGSMLDDLDLSSLLDMQIKPLGDRIRILQAIKKILDSSKSPANTHSNKLPPSIITTPVTTTTTNTTTTTSPLLNSARLSPLSCTSDKANFITAVEEESADKENNCSGENTSLNSSACNSAYTNSANNNSRLNSILRSVRDALRKPAKGTEFPTPQQSPTLAESKSNNSRRRSSNNRKSDACSVDTTNSASINNIVLRYEQVRRRCFRVFVEDGSASHVISAAELKSASEILEKIQQKFSQSQAHSNEWTMAICAPAELLSPSSRSAIVVEGDSGNNSRTGQLLLRRLSDQELWQICKPCAANSQPHPAKHLLVYKRIRLPDWCPLVNEGAIRLTEMINSNTSIISPLLSSVPVSSVSSVSSPQQAAEDECDAVAVTPAADEHTLTNTELIRDRPPSDIVSLNLEVFFPYTVTTNSNTNTNSHNRTLRRINTLRCVLQRSCDDRIVKQRAQTVAILPQCANANANVAVNPIPPRPPIPPQPNPNLEVLKESREIVTQESKENETIMNSSLPPVFGQWIKGDLIGKGSFANVYYGINPQTGQLMAVKQVAMPNIANPIKHKTKQPLKQIQMINALQTEINLLSQLDHENIVRYFGSYSDGKYFNVFLEYVSGGSIASIIRLYGSVSLEYTRLFIPQILSGLDYLHQRNIIHRDIKVSECYIM